MHTGDWFESSFLAALVVVACAGGDEGGTCARLAEEDATCAELTATPARIRLEAGSARPLRASW